MTSQIYLTLKAHPSCEECRISRSWTSLHTHKKKKRKKGSRSVCVKHPRQGVLISSPLRSISRIHYFKSIFYIHPNLTPATVKETRKGCSFFFFHYIQRQHISPWDTAFNRQVLESSICSGLRTKGSINEGFIGYINNHLCLLLWEALWYRVSLDMQITAPFSHPWD